MNEIVSVLAYGIGALCLGAALVLALLFKASNRYTHDAFEGCLGKLITLSLLTVAVIFFTLAVIEG